MQRALSIYHLHARLFEGPLAAPTRDERREAETDNWNEARSWAFNQIGGGFTVWVYDHGHSAPLSNASDLRVIAYAQPGTAATGLERLPRPSGGVRTPTPPARSAPGRPLVQPPAGFPVCIPLNH